MRKIKLNGAMKGVLTAVLIFCAVAAATAQTKRFRWTDELCEFEGTYNAKKYTAAQLANTVKLYAAFGGIPLDTEATVWKYEDIKKLSVARLDKEYQTKSAALGKLDIVKSPYWENLRAQRLKEMKQVYELSRVTMLGYDDPAKLKEATFAETCVTKYASPLIEGGDDLLKTWLAVNEEKRARNSDPERLKRIFEAEYDSPDRLKFARVEVMAFGFWNCANEFIEYEKRDGSHEDEFKKLFKQTKTIYCDEP